MTAQSRRIKRYNKKLWLNGPRFSGRWNNKEKKNYFGLRTLFVFVVFVAIGIFALFSNTSEWNKDFSLGLVSEYGENDFIEVTSFDPVRNRIFTVTIPKTTVVEVARGYGKWRLGSVSSLGEKEGVGKKLLVETVSRYFKLPVRGYVVAERNAFDASGRVFRFVLGNSETNLTFADRLKLSLFVLGVANTDKRTVNLDETYFLEQSPMIDGENGYRLTRSLPQEYTTAFTNNLIQKENLKINIVDGVRNFSLSEQLSNDMRSLGFNIVLVETNTQADVYDCIIRVENVTYLSILGKYFECGGEVGGINGDFDVEFVYGSDFSNNY